MSLFQNLFEWATGTSPVNRFWGRLRQASRETGWVPVSTDDEVAIFKLTDQSRDYDVAVILDEDSVKIAALSGCKFAPHRVPPIILSVMRQRNESLEVFAWKLFEGRSNWRPMAVAGCRIDAFNGGLFRHAVQEMLPEVDAFDAGLRRNGLV